MSECKPAKIEPKRQKFKEGKSSPLKLQGYGRLFEGISSVLDAARKASARTVNAIMTATYWEIGRRIVEYEQKGRGRADYGEELLMRLSSDLSARFSRGFAKSNLYQIRAFYLAYREIFQIASGKSTHPPSFLMADTCGAKKFQTVSGKSDILLFLQLLSARFPLPWSAYVSLLSVKSEHARRSYEEEALRGGWSVRQFDRQIDSQFYERTALSRNKAAMLKKGAGPLPSDAVTPEQEIKDPYILEFLKLKDEYSESDLEEALINHLERFLLELGGDFCFVERQRRLRIGYEWYRVDLVFFHYAREHWTHTDENPPVGLILCARKNEALARYALENLPNKVMAAECRTALPDERLIAAEMERTRRMWDARLMKSARSCRTKKG